MAAAQPPALPDLDEFESITLTEIGHRFKHNRPATIAWCRTYGLLATRMACNACGEQCQNGVYNRSIDKVTWRCGVEGCRKTTNIRRGSFFELSKLEIWQCIALSYIWTSSCGRSRGMSQATMMKEVQISEHTTVDWKQFFRDVSVQYFTNHPEQIGGPGVIVEVDESLFARRKNNVGRVIADKWVLGGYEPARRKGFLVEVQQRDAATLLPIIQQWVAPGSIVLTDMWAAYHQLPNLPGQNYVHGTVNHSVNFVDPITGVTTNHVEAMWQRAKSKFKAQHGPTNRNMVADYLAEFMWCQRFSDTPFFHLWSQIATDMYPVN